MSRAALLSCVAIAVVVLALDARVVTFDWFTLDDDSLVIAMVDGTHDPHPVLTREMGHAMPVTLAVYRTVFDVAGLTPGPYHAVNLVAHLLACMALFWLAWTLSGRDPPVALGATLLFAVHPIVVEPVAWVTSFKDVGHLCLTLTTVILALRASTDDRRLGGRYALIGLLAVIALGIKPTAAALVPVLAYIALARGHLRRAAPWIVIGGLCALGLGAMMLTRAWQRDEFYVLVDTGLGDRVALVGYVFVASLRRLADIGAMRPQYSYLWAGIDVTAAQTVMHLTALAAALAATVALLVQRVDDRRLPRLRPITPVRLGIVWAWAMYLPNSGWLGSVQVIVQDRYLYSAWAGIALALAAVAVAAARRLRARPGARLIVPLAAVAVVGLAAAAHLVRLTYWPDGATYWTDVSERVEPVPGDIHSQEVCVNAARAHAFRYSGPRAQGERVDDDYYRVLAAAARCDLNDPRVQATIAHAARRLLERGVPAATLEAQLRSLFGRDIAIR